MTMIKVNDLTFGYEGSQDNVFEHVSFLIDTDWKLGLIGRNGKGKTTFLKLLMNKYDYKGSIRSTVLFQYFPVAVQANRWNENGIDLMEEEFPDYELWKVIRELEYLKMDADVLYRPFGTLSFGERTRVMLAFLFANEEQFLLLDEPTNHLDEQTRDIVKKYLNRKKGFILVSHEREFLDSCVDHILSINRSSITVTKGNFSVWQENKERQDNFELEKNASLLKDIKRLEHAAKQSAAWADKVEQSKIGYNPIEEYRFIGSRSYIGEKSRRMQQRRKNLERRQYKGIEEKRELLKDVEQDAVLKIFPQKYYKDTLLTLKDVGICYEENEICRDISFTIKNGERLVLRGKNGCGKSSVIKAILRELGQGDSEYDKMRVTGSIITGAGLDISYVSQDTSMLAGTLDEYADKMQIELSLFLTILRQLDFEREQFQKKMEDFSEGQKKKVLIAASLCRRAHLYIWDEPMNYIDVFSRLQIEKLIQNYEPTMLIVEHDSYFVHNVSTKIVDFHNGTTEVKEQSDIIEAP